MADDEEVQRMELESLKVKYHTLQVNKERIQKEYKKTFRKQEEIIRELEIEKQKLMKDLSIIERKNKSERVKKEKLIEIADEKERLLNSVDYEKRKCEEIQKELEHSSRQLMQSRNKLRQNGGDQNSKQQRNLEKKINILENRLQQTNKKFSTYLVQNKKLKEDIDNLLIEKKAFEKHKKKLDDQLLEKRTLLEETIKKSKKSFEDKKEAQNSIVQAQMKSDKEKLQHTVEMKDRVLTNDNDFRLKEFMVMKSRERTEDPGLVAWRQQKENAAKEKRMKENADHSLEALETSYTELMKYLKTEQNEISGNESDENDEENNEEVIKKKKKKKNSDLSDITKQLIDQYTEQDNIDFATFQYVNEQNTRIEGLTDDIEKLEIDVAELKSEGGQLQGERKKMIESLQTNHDQLEKRSEEMNQEIEQNQNILDQLISGLDSMMKKIVKENVRPASIDNMNETLGIIEKRTNELLAAKVQLTSSTIIGEGPKIPGTSTLEQSQVKKSTTLLPNPPNINELANQIPDDAPKKRDELVRSFI
ncbi:hypothetical protein SNEBB_002733 [Seison nebaliae]|nr:hypothetical protein SNEBB_002733 [Seison nebaliae]